MEANTGNKETAGREGNVPKKSGTSSVGETGVGQQATPGMGSTFPTLNPMAASFTPRSQTATTAGLTSVASGAPTERPASPRRSTPPSLERFARELRELKSTGLSNTQRLAEMHDQRRQLLSHMTATKAEIDELEGRLEREESIEGSQDILNRLKELKGLHEWAGHKWVGLEEEMAELEAEIAVPGEDEFWGL